jgi:hypothetical protein
MHRWGFRKQVKPKLDHHGVIFYHDNFRSDDVTKISCMASITADKKRRSHTKGTRNRLQINESILPGPFVAHMSHNNLLLESEHSGTTIGVACRQGTENQEYVVSINDTCDTTGHRLEALRSTGTPSLQINADQLANQTQAASFLPSSSNSFDCVGKPQQNALQNPVVRTAGESNLSYINARRNLINGAMQAQAHVYNYDSRLSHRGTCGMRRHVGSTSAGLDTQFAGNQEFVDNRNEYEPMQSVPMNGHQMIGYASDSVNESRLLFLRTTTNSSLQQQTSYHHSRDFQAPEQPQSAPFSKQYVTPIGVRKVRHNTFENQEASRPMAYNQSSDISNCSIHQHTTTNGCALMSTETSHSNISLPGSSNKEILNNETSRSIPVWRKNEIEHIHGTITYTTRTGTLRTEASFNNNPVARGSGQVNHRRTALIERCHDVPPSHTMPLPTWRNGEKHEMYGTVTYTTVSTTPLTETVNHLACTMGNTHQETDVGNHSPCSSLHSDIWEDSD